MHEGLLPPYIGLLCLGLGGAIGAPDLSPTDLSAIADRAAALHSRVGRRAAPSPYALADAAGVRLMRDTAGQPWPAMAPEWGIYPVAARGEEQGLMAAHCLAGCLLRRSGEAYREVAAWVLAAELVAPAWLAEMVEEGGTEWAPGWLLELRRSLVVG